MNFIADTHLHIYPFYRIDSALSSLINNLHAWDPEATKIGCLTERFDCHVFEELSSFQDSRISGDFDVDKCEDHLLITHKLSGLSVHLLPGQQIITSENLEVLSLNCSTRIKEDQSAQETIEQILAAEGVPVLAFGFGKWLGKRGKIVNNLIARFSAEQLAMGDTTMRPYGWATPLAFRKASQKNMSIINGSDPLPFNGEESRPGAYASRISTNGTSVTEAIGSILNQSSTISPAGKRNSLIQVAGRMQNHRKAGKIATG